MNNKLFCTFTLPENISKSIEDITKKYQILFDKIFIFSSPDIKENIITYNIENGNINSSTLINTILIHRKKETSTLYTIDALNHIIKGKNDGRLSKTFEVDWSEYKKSLIVLNKDNTLKRINIEIQEIINL